MAGGWGGGGGVLNGEEGPECTFLIHTFTIVDL